MQINKGILSPMPEQQLPLVFGGVYPDEGRTQTAVEKLNSIMQKINSKIYSIGFRNNFQNIEME